jgi:hypothetical protein
VNIETVLAYMRAYPRFRRLDRRRGERRKHKERRLAGTDLWALNGQIEGRERRGAGYDRRKRQSSSTKLP